MKIHPYQSTPCGFQSLWEFGETLAKSACWVGDYKPALPTESEKAVKSCLGLQPPSPPPCPLPRLSVSVWLLSASHVPLTSFHLPSTLVLPVRLCLLPLPSSLTFLTLRPRRLFVLCFFFFHSFHSSPRISRWSGRNRGRVAVILEGEGVRKTQACGGLIRHPRWQGSLAWIG